MPAAKPPPPTVQVDPAGNRLRADAAASYLRMLADGLPPGGVDVFLRSLETQKRLYRKYLEGRGPLAAKPSPTAPHVQGIAMDLRTGGRGPYSPSPAHVWLTEGGDGSSKPKTGEKLRAHAYGWRRTVPSERWHFGYTAATDTKRADDLATRLAKLGFSSVTKFQRDRGLVDDGKDGPQTWAALLAATGRARASGIVLPSVGAPTLARVVTFNCAAFGRTQVTAAEADALVAALRRMAGSIYTLTECPEWLRNHLRGTCVCVPGAHQTIGDPSRWRVAIRGAEFSQAILFDSMKWSYLGASRGQFGPTSYHGYLIAAFEQTTTRAALTVGGYHLPPNVVASDDFQKRVLANMIDQMPATGPRVLAGDGADESGWVAGWDDARIIAKKSPDRDAVTYKQSIRDRIHSRAIHVRRYTVVPSNGASDHAGVLAQITIPALGSTD